MPSLRHNSAMLSSPRRPAITMRIFSSAEYCRRVARRISRTRFSASAESVSTFDLIAAPSRLDELKTLSSSITHFCPTCADGEQLLAVELSESQVEILQSV